MRVTVHSSHLTVHISSMHFCAFHDFHLLHRLQGTNRGLSFLPLRPFGSIVRSRFFHISPSNVEITVRFFHGADKRSVTLVLSPLSPLWELRRLLAKQTQTDGAEKIRLSLEGRLLTSPDITVEQAYGGTPFAVVLDARVEGDATAGEEKSPDHQKPTATAPSSSEVVPKAVSKTVSELVVSEPSCIDALALPTLPVHPGCKLVNEEVHDDELQCKICFSPCLDPVVLPCCEKLICRACNKENKCPFDRTELKGPLTEQLRVICNMLERVQVECKECQVVLKRGLKGELFAKHVETACPVSCIWGCGSPLVRATMAAHEGVCLARVVSCSAADVGCAFESARGLLPQHEQGCRLIEFAPFLRRIDMLEAKVRSLEYYVKTNSGADLTKDTVVAALNIIISDVTQVDTQLAAIAGAVGVDATNLLKIASFPVAPVATAPGSATTRL